MMLNTLKYYAFRLLGYKRNGFEEYFRSLKEKKVA